MKEYSEKIKHKGFEITIRGYTFDNENGDEVWLYYAYVDNKYLEADEGGIEICTKDGQAQFYSLEDIKETVGKFIDTIDN